MSESDKPPPRPTSHGRRTRDITPYPPEERPRSGNAVFDQILERLDDLGMLMTRMGNLERGLELVSRSVTEVKSIVAADVALSALTADPKDSYSGPISLVLVVEDQPLLQKAMRRLLEANGMRSMVAISAEEAQELLHRNAIDVALVDIRLRGSLSGIDLARWILSHYSNVGIVILTGLLTPEDAAEAKELGIRVLPKPFDNTDLIEAIREAYARTTSPPDAAG